MILKVLFRLRKRSGRMLGILNSSVDQQNGKVKTRRVNCKDMKTSWRTTREQEVMREQKEGADILKGRHAASALAEMKSFFN